MIRANWIAAIIAFPIQTVGAQICGRDSAQTAVLSRPVNYIFFNRDRERISDSSFLENPRVAGAELTFTWRELERSRDRYNFDEIRKALSSLRQHGRGLVVQLQDVSFSENIPVPKYLLDDSAFHGGAARKYEGADQSHAQFNGWVARRWDPAVRSRYFKLLDTLASELDGKIEAIVLPETAVPFDDPALRPADFTNDGYLAGMEAIASEARHAFARSCVIVYANFFPGEWLPDDDKGYLRGFYEFAGRTGVGVGGPDLLPHRLWQMNHSYPLIAKRPRAIVAGLGVQDGNLADRDRVSGKQVTVDELYRFASDYLHLDFVFWGTEEPYYTRDILPYLRALPR